MNWFSRTLTSTIGRKLVMALTGLFLCSFLVVHLAGNLQLLKGDEGQAFNVYAKFMTTTTAVKILSYGLYAGFILHIVQSLLLTLHNRKARPVGYAYQNSSANSPWTSRNMGIFGTVILFFLVVHMKQFWFEMHFGQVPVATYEGVEHKNLYEVVKFAFAEPLYVLLYVVSMVAVAFHLVHGFQSAFQSLGINHVKYTPFIKLIGYGFAIIVPLLYAAIPVIMFLS